MPINDRVKGACKTEAIETISNRRKGIVSQQEEHLNSVKQPVFLTTTRTYIDAEKKLIAFITKSLSLNLLLELGSCHLAIF